MASSYKILIVEDDQEICCVLSAIVSSLGYESVSANDGFQALERLEAEQFSVAILDLMLPGPDGIEILKRIREQWLRTEVIMLTAYASLDTALNALRLGAYDYVTKPFEVDVLRSTVRRAVEKQRLEIKLDAIHDLSREIALSLSVGQVAEVVLDIVERVLEFEGCYLLLIDEERDELYRVAERGRGEEVVPRLPLGGEKGITVAAARSGEPLCVPNVREDPRYVEVIAATQSELAVPLKVKGRVVGVLNVESAEVDAFSQMDVRLLSTLAAQTAVAIERVRAEEALRRRNRQLALLNQASQAFSSVLDLGQILTTVLEETRGLMDVIACSIWLIDHKTGDLVCQQATGPQNEIVRGWRLAPGEGIAGWTVCNSESLIVPDTQADERYYGGVDRETGLSLRSILSVPLWGKEYVIGVLQAVDVEANRFDTTDLALLEPLAASAAIAIENARLYGQARKEITERARVAEALRKSEKAERAAREQAETLRRATAALASTLDLDVVLDSILTHLEQVIPYASASVLLLKNGNGKEKGRLCVVAARGLPTPDLVIGHGFSADNALWLELDCTQRPLVLADARADPRFERWDGVDFSYIRGWMGVPLIVQGELIGYLTFDSRQVSAYGEAEAALAQAFANQAAVAIQNARLFEEVRIGRERLQAFSRRYVEAQEAERAHIARELHDETGQALSAMLLGLSLFEREVDRPDAVIARATELAGMVDGMLGNLHRMATNLRPASLDLLGLSPAMAQYIETFGHQYGITAQFEALVGIGGERLPAAVETALYRITQEALTNVARHAQATRVDVLLERRGDQIVTIVEDDGVGFDINEAMRSSRLGLFGMRERAEMFGGTLTIESTIGAGTTVFVEIPDVKCEA